LATFLLAIAEPWSVVQGDRPLCVADLGANIGLFGLKFLANTSMPRSLPRTWPG